jgi:hypothetical protein
VPVVYPNQPPADDSLANQQPASTQTTAPIQVATPPTPKHNKAKTLVKHVHSRLVNHHTLVLSFTLTARARVQLIARRKRTVVARSRLQSLAAGRHQLSLQLDPQRWPTGFQFKATPASGEASGGGSTEEAGSGNTIST